VKAKRKGFIEERKRKDSPMVSEKKNITHPEIVTGSITEYSGLDLTGILDSPVSTLLRDTSEASSPPPRLIVTSDAQASDVISMTSLEMASV
jgi:hypothetical protein